MRSIKSHIIVICGLSICACKKKSNDYQIPYEFYLKQSLSLTMRRDIRHRDLNECSENDSGIGTCAKIYKEDKPSRLNTSASAAAIMEFPLSDGCNPSYVRFTASGG